MTRFVSFACCLLLLARTDQGRALETEPVDLVRIAREAADDFSAADPERPLERDLEGSAVVTGDPIRPRQATRARPV